MFGNERTPRGAATLSAQVNGAAQVGTDFIGTRTQEQKHNEASGFWTATRQNERAGESGLPTSAAGQMPASNGQAAGQLASGLPGQSEGQAGRQSAGQSQPAREGQVAGQMTQQYQGQSQGQLPGQPQGQVSGQMAGQAAAQGQGQTQEPAQDQPPSQPAEQTSGESEYPSFEQVLQDKAYQREFDRRVNKALQTAKSKWQTEQEEAIAAAVSAYAQEKQAELQSKEQELAKRERRAGALLQLSTAGLPAELAGSLDYASDERCAASFEQVAGAFRAAVQQGVSSRLQSFAPPKLSGQEKKISDPFYMGFDK